MKTLIFYYCFGLFRLAVIAQQIYYRFYHGQTQDQRFAMMIHGVRGLEQQARHLIAQFKIIVKKCQMLFNLSGKSL